MSSPRLFEQRVIDVAPTGVTGGEQNVASGLHSSVTGGQNNSATHQHSAVAGGQIRISQDLVYSTRLARFAVLIRVDGVSQTCQ